MSLYSPSLLPLAPFLQEVFVDKTHTNKRAASWQFSDRVTGHHMSALRCLNALAAAYRHPSALFARRNATLLASANDGKGGPGTAASNVVPAGQQKNRRRRRRQKIEIHRPPISTESPRKWNRPLAEGVLPAYDLAIQLIKKDSSGLKLEACTLRAEIDAAEATIQSMFSERDAGMVFDEGVLEAKDQEIEKMRKRLHILEVQSEVNLPNVRWTVANAMGA